MITLRNTLKKNLNQNQKSNNPNYEELGKMLVNIYETGYIDRVSSYKASFMKGIFGGLGGVVGATIVVGLLVWILSLFHNVPLIGRFVENVRQTVNTETR